MHFLLCCHLKLTYHLHLGGTFLTIVVVIVHLALFCGTKISSFFSQMRGKILINN